MLEPYVVGATIHRREVLHSQVWLEHPVTVVADDGAVLAVRLDPGSPFHFPAHPSGPHPWAANHAWGDSIVLQLSRCDTWYGVWKFFDTDGTFRHWYLNFESPVVRQRDGIETDDYGLDLVIYPGGRREWKDVEDLHHQRAEGRISSAIVLKVLAAAAEVVTELDAGERWWAGWDAWQPDEVSDA